MTPLPPRWVGTATYNINPNGGLWVGSAEVSLCSREYGDTITGGQPIRPGFTFKGLIFSGDGSWNSADGIYTFSGTDSAADTLEADWLINTYRLVINPNGGAVNGSVSNLTVSQNYGTSFTVPVPVRTGYTFEGWSLNGDGSYEGSVYTFSGTDDTDDCLTALWSLNTYSLIINPSGGSLNGSAESQTVTQGYGSSFAVPVPVRPGYSFIGWEFCGDGRWNEDESSYMFIGTDNTPDTLTAEGAIKKFGVIINPNGGTWNGSANISTVIKEYGTALPVSEPQRTGYTFSGWVLSGDGTWNSESSIYILNGTDSQIDLLKANWAINSYMLKVNPNGGSWNGSADISTVIRNMALLCPFLSQTTGLYLCGLGLQRLTAHGSSKTATYTLSGPMIPPIH